MTYFRVRGFYSIYLGALVGSSTERILIGSNDLHRFWEFSYVGHADDMLKIHGSPHMLHPHALTVDREHSSSPDPARQLGSVHPCLAWLCRFLILRNANLRILTGPGVWRITLIFDQSWTPSTPSSEPGGIRGAKMCIFRCFPETPQKHPILTPPRKWPISGKCPKMPNLRGCEILLGGGTNMWSNPPNYLLFRYPPWPPKWGFLDPPPGGWFWGGYRKLRFRACANRCFCTLRKTRVLCTLRISAIWVHSPNWESGMCHDMTPSGMGSCQ